MNDHSAPVGDWHGRCGFRLMPDDDLAAGASTAQVREEAQGHGWSLRYTWTHPQDGDQAGILLLGTPTDDGTVAAGWVDSWHQKPELRLLTGLRGEGGRVSLTMDYSGWGWTIELAPEGDTLRMVMGNVIPDGLEGHEPGPYVVMDAVWSRTEPSDPAGPSAPPDPLDTLAP